MGEGEILPSAAFKEQLRRGDTFAAQTEACRVFSKVACNAPSFMGGTQPLPPEVADMIAFVLLRQRVEDIWPILCRAAERFGLHVVSADAVAGFLGSELMRQIVGADPNAPK